MQGKLLCKYPFAVFVSLLLVVLGGSWFARNSAVAAGVQPQNQPPWPTRPGAAAPQQLAERDWPASLRTTVRATVAARLGRAAPAQLNGQQLTASDGRAFDRFGVSVAVSGDTAVVGAYTAKGFLGEAYVFVRQGSQWVEQATLNVPSPAPNTQGQFGQSVAIDGNTIAVGAPVNFGGNKGVYIYVRNGATWTFQARLTAGDGGQNDDLFGIAVALNGDTVVAGAPNQNGQRGAVYVYTRTGTTWTQQQKVTVDGIIFTANFGVSVAVGGDRLLVGANGDGPQQLLYRGAVYFFTRAAGVWSQQQKIEPNDPRDFAEFGSSLSLDGDNLAIGADGATNTTIGAAYVFTFASGQWTQQAKVVSGDGAGDQFGITLGLSGDVLIIGGFGTNAAYLFRRNGTSWALQEKLLGNGGGFANAVTARGRFLFVGAPTLTVNEDSLQGAVYVYPIPPTIQAAAGITLQQGSPAGAAPLATVSDIETPPGELIVLATSVPAGLTISQLTNTAGTITAQVAAGCAAALGNQTIVLTVSNGISTASANFSVNVTANTPPVFAYDNQTVTAGGSLTVNPVTAPSDNGSVSAMAVAQVTPTFHGALTVSQTGAVTINNAGPAGNFTVVIRATDNCNVASETSFGLSIACPSLTIRVKNQ